MLANRILATIRFFDLQNIPATATEVHKYLVSDPLNLKTKLDANFELIKKLDVTSPQVHFDTIITQLHILSREGRIFQNNGFYTLVGREPLIAERAKSYFVSLKRERLIRRFAKPTRHIPFVRSIALLGSQALGQQKPSSDIDLFVITDPKFIGLARFFLTTYFQILGIRRHGIKVANRFCLNHYLAGSISLKHDRNLYTAFEYLKFRSLIYPQNYSEFLENNDWILLFFPNATLPKLKDEQHSSLQIFLEKLLNNKIGLWLESKVISAQLARIEQSEFTIHSHSELSFHPNNRKQKLFQSFFEDHEQKHRKME